MISGLISYDVAAYGVGKREQLRCFAHRNREHELLPDNFVHYVVVKRCVDTRVFTAFDEALRRLTKSSSGIPDAVNDA